MLTASLLFTALLLPAAMQDGDVVSQAHDLAQRGRTAAAITVLENALNDGGGDEAALRVALADLQTGNGSPQQALDTLDPLDAHSLDVALALGRAETARADQIAQQGGSQEDIDAALAAAHEHYASAVEAGHGNGPGVWALGQHMLYRENDLDGALALAEQALASDPEDGEAHLLRGAAGAYVYWNATQAKDIDGANQAWNAAVKDLEQANKTLDTDRLEPLGQLVWFYEDQDISGKAVDAARAIVERQPEPDFSLLFRLARKYRDSGQLQASGKALETIVSMSALDLTRLIKESDDPELVASRLSASIDPYYKSEDKATCRAILAAITASQPTDPVIWDNYALICQETARYDDAVAAYEHKIELQPDDPRTYSDLGAVYQFFLRRDNDKAKQLYEQCISIADRQLAMLDLDPALKQHAAEAKGIAEDNMRQLSPGKTAGKGLLDSMVSGLRSLNLPKAAKDEGSDDGDEEGSDGGEG